MQLNALIQLAVDGKTAEELDKLLAKICKAAAAQPGVIFAYPVRAPVPRAVAPAVRAEAKAPEELFN